MPQPTGQNNTRVPGANDINRGDPGRDVTRAEPHVGATDPAYSHHQAFTNDRDSQALSLPPARNGWEGKCGASVEQLPLKAR
jgi:hypothetical protein